MNSIGNGRWWLSRLAIASVVYLLATSAHAQQEATSTAGAAGISEATPDSALEEIIVTGTYRETALQTTPIAVTAVTPEVIERSFTRDIRGVADMVPNLNVTTAPAFGAAAAIGIRGTGTLDIVSTIDSAVGVVLDGMHLPSVQGQLLDPFDVEQVEVMRGPQGTLFGKNTTGGVVLVRSRPPIMNEFSGKVQLLGGNLDTNEVRAAVNIPIAEDVLAFRGVVSYEKNSGYYSNDKISTVYATAAQPETPLGLAVNGDGRDLGGRDSLYSKAKFLLAPSDNYEALLTLEFADDNSPVTPLVNETPANGLDSFGVQRDFLLNALGFPGIEQTCPKRTNECILSTGVSFREDGLMMNQGQRVEAYGAYLNQDFRLDPGTLTVFTGYRTQEERLAGSYTGEAFPSLFDSHRALERDIFQGEVRFTSELEGPFQVTAGAAYFLNNLDFRHLMYIGFVNVPINLGGCDIENPENTPANCFVIGPGSNDRPVYEDLEMDGDATGIYTEMTYAVTDAVRLIAGGRYSREKKDFVRRASGVLTAEEVATFNRTSGDDSVSKQMEDSRFGLNFSDDHTWDGFTFKAGVDWTVDDHNFLYFTFNQGFKSGSYVETCTSVTGCAPFDEETADSWEIGYKSDWFDRTLRVDLVGFYTTIDDVVRSQSVPITNEFGEPAQETQFRNIAGQKNYGVELEAAWQATPALLFTASGSTLHAEYTSLVTDVNSGASLADAKNPECYDIDTLGNDNAVCIGIKPTFAPKLKLFGSATYTVNLPNSAALILNGDVNWQDKYELSLFNSDLTEFEERTLVNLNMTYAADKYELAFFVRNLTDEAYRVTANSVASLFNLTRYGEVRRYGAQLTVNF